MTSLLRTDNLFSSGSICREGFASASEISDILLAGQSWRTSAYKLAIQMSLLSIYSLLLFSHFAQVFYLLKQGFLTFISNYSNTQRCWCLLHGNVFNKKAWIFVTIFQMLLHNQLMDNWVSCTLSSWCWQMNLSYRMNKRISVDSTCWISKNSATFQLSLHNPTWICSKLLLNWWLEAFSRWSHSCKSLQRRCINVTLYIDGSGWGHSNEACDEQQIVSHW